MATIDQLSKNNADGTTLGQSATDKVSFYGAAPATQRTASVQAASLVSQTTFISITSNLAAFAAEVAATLTGLGLWKGA